MGKKIELSLRKIFKIIGWIILILFVVSFVFSFPLLIMHTSIANYLPIDSKLFNYSNYGTTGDAIGGMTAPLVNLIGAFLVFLALRAQIKANEIVQGQIDENAKEKALENYNKELNRLFEYFEKNISSIEFVNDGGTLYKGTKAVTQILDETLLLNHVNLKIFPIPEYASVFSSLRLCEMLIDKIRISKATIEEREYINELVSHCFYTYYFIAQESSIGKYKKYNRKCLDCGKLHDLPDDHIKLVKKIEAALTENRDFFSNYQYQKIKSQDKS